MDIGLNITTAPQPLRNKPALPKKKLKKINNADGFSFEFGGAQHKVKAVVAKRRPLKALVRSKNDAQQQSKVNSSQEASPPMRKSVAIKRKATSNVEPKTIQRTSKTTKGAETANTKGLGTATAPLNEILMLNISTTPVPIQRQQPKQKLSREERLNKKNVRQFSNSGKNERQFTKLKEPKEFLSPPKAVDEHTDNAISADEPELGKVNLVARKVNAFRVTRPEDKSVRKIGLFVDSTPTPVLGQRFVKPIQERLFDGTKVATLKLHPHAVKNLEDMLSITELTTVQRKTIPLALEGKDLLVRSQTGSGKTLAYALPIVENLQEIRPKLTRDAGILAVIIVPTRELAIQTYELFQKLLKPFMWIVPGVLMGGEKRKAEKARLRKGINILIGTPGRLVDHLLHTESLKLNKAKFLILDEADRLLEMGYERDVKQIVEAIDNQRKQLAQEMTMSCPNLQRMLLSATLTAAVQRLAGLTLRDPIFIDNSDEDQSKAIRNTPGYTKETIEEAAADLSDLEEDSSVMTIPENLKLHFVVVPPKQRLVTLSGLLAHEYKTKQRLKVIIFMSTMEMVNFHHDLLNEQLTKKILDDEDEPLANGKKESHEDDSSDKQGDQPLLKGLRFFKLHGSMTQTEREGVFKSFRTCQSGALISTDVAGRGIDVPAVDLVIQYSPPQKITDFVHRVGRTARAGKSGQAILFLAPSETQFVRFLEEKRIRISQVDMEVYLKTLNDADHAAHTIQEAASNLQYKFQELVEDDKEMHRKACTAFVSWTKYYSSFPKELKSQFNVKSAHMGHFAKSFALKDQPTSFTRKFSKPKPLPPTNRLTYTERDPEKLRVEKRAKQRRFATTVTNEKRNPNRPASYKLSKLLPASRALMTSEFDSGLPAPKKRKNQ